ncbi:VOC family protein [Clostridiaceae bacterium HFYG-1003]|nr:VOC family protein [Clostridiaceae bacterium HFYG-1003]
MVKGRFLHNNINVLDLDKSMAFYEKALGLTEKRRYVNEGNFILVYLWDGSSDYELELTWLNDRTEPYNLGDNEIHMAFAVEDKKEAYQLHSEMGVIIYENRDMDLYFIGDPDGYWIEILERGVDPTK